MQPCEPLSDPVKLPPCGAGASLEPHPDTWASSRSITSSGFLVTRQFIAYSIALLPLTATKTERRSGPPTYSSKTVTLPGTMVLFF